MDELTVRICQAMQAVCGDAYHTVKRAVTNPQDEIDRRVLESWTEIQTLIGARIGRVADDGGMTPEQYDFAMDWLANWIDYGPDEAEALLTAWIDWVAPEWRDTA